MSLPSLKSNILAHGVVQVGNSLIPLIAIPYLGRVLGAESYGEIVWIQTIMLFGIICVDFGFGWSVTREISTNRYNVKHISRLSANVWVLQWMIFLIFSLVILIMAWQQVDNYKFNLYAAGLAIVLGQILLPTWLFQGLEDIWTMALIHFISKILILPMLFVFVKNTEDQVWALLFFGVSSILAGIIALIWIAKNRMIIITKPDWPGMQKIFIEGVDLFYSRAIISIYTTLIPLAIGLWAGSVQLAYFNMADRLRLAVQSLLSPISQAIYPRMSLLFRNDQIAAISILRKSAFVMIGISGFAGLLLWIKAESWLVILGGAEFIAGASVLQWLAWVPCLVALSNLMGIQIMLPLEMNKSFKRIVSLASLVSIIFLYPAIQYAGAVGAATIVFLVEFLVSASMFIYLWNNFKKR